MVAHENSKTYKLMRLTGDSRAHRCYKPK